MKESYLKDVSEIFGRLTKAIFAFNFEAINAEQFQEEIKKAWEDKPKEYMLVNQDLVDALGLDERLIGEVIETAPYEGPNERAYAQEIIDGIIASVPEWEKTHNSHGMASIGGSNSLIQNVIGCAEWNYCRTHC